jgi:hypothetical protein
MNQTTPRQEITITLLLLGLMVMTRFHHFGSVTHLPDASWAIFLAAGFFLRRTSLFLLFMGTAVLIDFVAITRFGVSSFCVSSAYGFLVPAYGALWLGGRWLQAHFRKDLTGLGLLVLTVVASAAVAFLISSGSFYVLSGKAGDVSLAGFIHQSMAYFPWFLQVTAGYVAAFSVIYLVAGWFSQGRDLPSSRGHA